MKEHPERGSMSLFVAAFILIAIALLGLVVDGGQIRNARRQAADIAQGAARAGAQEIRLGDRLDGEVVVDPQDAAATARAYLAVAQADGDVQVDGSQVQVTVRLTVDLLLVGAVGERQVTARHIANATEGNP